MSPGITSISTGLAFATGASALLKNTPERFVNRKSAMIANGANFTERNTGILRGNFIKQNLRSNDDHVGHLNKFRRANCFGFGRLVSASLDSGAQSENVVALYLSFCPENIG